MVDLGQLAQSDAYAQTSGPGFGTRMLCRPLTEHNEAPIDGSMWLTGLRRANALSMNTNPIPNAHMRSPGGFMEFFAGLRDPGDIQFEACWKNDQPRGTTTLYIPKNSVAEWVSGDAVDDNDYVQYEDVVYQANKTLSGSMLTTTPIQNSADWDMIPTSNSTYYELAPTPDFQRWQAPKETDGAGNKGLFHSLFYDRQPFEAWVIPPQWTRGLIIVRGYASMVGPFPHEMEGVINFQGSFKASGKPMILRGISATAIVPTVAAINDRIRWVSTQLLEERWTDLVDVANTLVWPEDEPADNAGTFYRYAEDAGFAEAF